MKLRDQQIKYNQLPDREEMMRLYESYTLQEIADMYLTSKTRVRKWFDRLGIEKRCRGGGNNNKFDKSVTKEYLIELIRTEKTFTRIKRKIGCCSHTLIRLLKKYDLVLAKRQKTPEYAKYVSKVRRLTEKVYYENVDVLNPNGYARTKSGVDGGYQIDHKLSVRFCYDNGISAEECASLENLQMLTWQENLNKTLNNIYEEQYVANRGTPGKLDA